MIIPINRKRFPIVFVISIILTILFSINLYYTKTDSMYMNGLFNWIFNIILVCVFLYYTIVALIEYLKTRFDKNAMLMISESGIDDNLSIFSCGKIPWADISNVTILKVAKTDFLVVKLFDNEKYLRNKNFIQKRVLRGFIKKSGSPVLISQYRVNYDLHDIQNLIKEHKY